MIPPWLNTFRPVKIQQRHVLWSKEGGLSGYGAGGDGAMSIRLYILWEVLIQGIQGGVQIHWKVERNWKRRLLV